MSVGVSSRSSATLSPSWLATIQPLLGTSVIARSSNEISQEDEPAEIVLVPLLRKVRTSSVASCAPIALAISWTAPPNFVPRVLKFALIEISTKSPSASAISSSEITLSSSAICSRIATGNDAQPLAAMRARDSGWRILTPDSARAARPSSTILFVRETSRRKSRLIMDLSAIGKSLKCTE
ncbi:unannotated protein [freshwater metagenome]|uniref:Unannotated protein n=1 Tax=freshwater metagenome TaxID=449393 RepID=A0A6J7VZA1_9ZZZZ